MTTTPLGFVHAVEQNHLHLSVIGGGAAVQLPSGKAVTNPLDPVFVYNYVFGARRPLDLAAAEHAFRAAGRDYVHVSLSPSSWPGLEGQLAAAGFEQVETQSYRRASGTGAGAPGLLPVSPTEPEPFLEVWMAAWKAEGHDPEQRLGAVRRRLADPRSRAWRTADGSGVLLLFTAGPTTQLAHLAVEPSQQGRGLGRRVLERAPGLVPAGRPLWLFTQRGGRADRAAEQAGWERSHTAQDWLRPLG